MDAGKDEKSIVEKTVEAVREFAAIVSEAAHKAMEPESIRAGDEVVMMPAGATGFMGDTVAPPLVVVRKQKNSTRKSRAKTGKKTAKEKSAKKAQKTTAKKSRKLAESSASRKQVGKKTHRGAKKAANKSRR
jgi:hypothetical protein